MHPLVSSIALVVMGLIFCVNAQQDPNPPQSVGVPEIGSHCVCPDLTLKQKFEYADYIFRGRVLSSYIEEEGSPFVIYKVKRESNCKVPDPLLGVYDPRSDIFYFRTARHVELSCGGVDMQVGDSYILFGRVSSQTNHGFLDRCLTMPFMKLQSFELLQDKYCAGHFGEGGGFLPDDQEANTPIPHVPV